ncbi:MAG: aldo/keto reductase [Polyangiaceae bacterium]|nr:aldo/keto reductase [Polyangiaceae bacterium]
MKARMPTTSIPGISLPVSRLVQGCMMLSEANLEGGMALLDAAAELGVNAFDNAYVYGGGQCERVLGSWMQARGNREKSVVITKGCHPTSPSARVTPEAMQSDLEESLVRLKTSYVDLWLFHRDDPSQPVGPLVEQADRLKRAGKLRAYGGSNWSVPRIQEARAYAERHGLAPMVASSPHFSLAEQIAPPWGGCTSLAGSKSAEDRRWHEVSGVAVFAWSSLASGFLSGRIRRDNFEAIKSEFPEHCARTYASETNFQRLERLVDLAKKKECAVPELALAYVVNQKFSCFAVCGAVSSAEVASSVRAVNLSLSESELAYLETGA